jgi:hypothetical protein
VAEGEGALFAPGDEAAGDGGFLAVESIEIIEDGFGVMGAVRFGGVRVEALLAHAAGFPDANISDLV